MAALPKLIKLNPVVVREVFNRLLGVHGESCITPTELLVALHLLDQSKVDLKTIMKATSLCISEKQVCSVFNFYHLLAVLCKMLLKIFLNFATLTDIYSRSVSCCTPTINGSTDFAYFTHENSNPSLGFVSPIIRICNEYLTKAYIETGI